MGWVIDAQNSGADTLPRPGIRTWRPLEHPAGVRGSDPTLRCNGTSWLAKEYNSTQCGYVPPTGLHEPDRRRRHLL